MIIDTLCSYRIIGISHAVAIPHAVHQSFSPRPLNCLPFTHKWSRLIQSITGLRYSGASCHLRYYFYYILLCDALWWLSIPRKRLFALWFLRWYLQLLEITSRRQSICSYIPLCLSFRTTICTAGGIILNYLSYGGLSSWLTHRLYAYSHLYPDEPCTMCSRAGTLTHTFRNFIHNYRLDVLIGLARYHFQNYSSHLITKSRLILCE